MPPIEEYYKYIQMIYEDGLLTNQGNLLRELEEKLSRYLGVEYLHYVTNGTVALQLALKSLDIEDGEIITTPFSYVATTSSILWERSTPIFVDIEPKNFTIDADKIEAKITDKTRAIMAVHVFGYACDVDKIQKIADKYNLKVIYDAAHAFGSLYKGQSLINFGDISICSFHATKLFHTIEGGACVTKNKILSDKIELIKRFGHNNDYYCLGINAKQSEFHAAMGLANYPYIGEIIDKRRSLCELYNELLSNIVRRPADQLDLVYNYAYYPVVFRNEDELLRVVKALNNSNIFPRRYFYPSLNKLPYLSESDYCPISENISSRVACLPLYTTLEKELIIQICTIIRKAL